MGTTTERTAAATDSADAAVEPGVLGLTTMTASGCLPCQLAQEQGKGQYRSDSPTRAKSPVTDDLADAVTQAPDAPQESATTARWSGVIGMEGKVTGDGRLIEKNALRWEDLPIPFRYVSADVGAHDGAEVVGTIDTIERRDGGVIWGAGDMDLASPAGQEAYRQVDEEYTTGVSMDLDDVTFEVRVAADVLDEQDAMMEALFDPDGDAEPPERDENPDGSVTVATISPDDEVRVTTDGRVRAATIVAIPAFAEAHISIDHDADPAQVETSTETEAHALLDTVTASAAPLEPPSAWFSDPNLTGPTPMTFTADGRVFGHIALWGTCHTGHAQQGKCISPPSSPSNYAQFHVGSLLTAEGTEVAVGHLTMDTKHAADKLTARSAAVHYDNTGAVAADVRAGEDAYGIYLAGALRPGVSPQALRSLRSAPMSGDWRRFGTALDLVAVLAVNMPGFPVPRPSGLVASGAVQSLVASGMLPPTKVRRPGTEGALSEDDLRYLRRLAARERKNEALALKERVTVTQRAERERRIHALAASIRTTDTMEKE